MRASWFNSADIINRMKDYHQMLLALFQSPSQLMSSKWDIWLNPYPKRHKTTFKYLFFT